MSIWPNQRDVNKFYGNPDKNQDGVADRVWEDENIVKIIPPYDLWYPDDSTGKLIKRKTKFKHLRVHKKCSDSLTKILTRIGMEISESDRIKYELDICGGVYNFRLMRSGRALSIHSYGAAIDLSHLINSYKKKYVPNSNMMPMSVVNIFKDEGWTWGGLWSTGDAMHFQAANI